MIMLCLFSTAATIAVPNGYGDIYGPNPAFLPSPRYYPGLEQLHSQFDAPGPYSFYSASGYYPYNLQFQGPYPGSTFSPYGGPNLAVGIGRSVDPIAKQFSNVGLVALYFPVS